ncbi:hypothetical protein ACL6C3_09470 [Capilliphycus salinus ALCB114379]|uniref:hypothetical protein n=1 Tax=Capilliphycus salinus TaxID=2768948 RepID=UPI0039A43446
MIPKKLLDLEHSISSLSFGEKLWLLERIVQQLRKMDEAELSEMANDPEVQAELIAINDEFVFTEMDGLSDL